MPHHLSPFSPVLLKSIQTLVCFSLKCICHFANITMNSLNKDMTKLKKVVLCDFKKILFLNKYLNFSIFV